MTTSVSNEETSVVVAESASPAVENELFGARRLSHPAHACEPVCVSGDLRRDRAFRARVRNGSLLGAGFFNLGGLTILFLWMLDAWTLGNLRVSRNLLQLPLLGSLFSDLSNCCHSRSEFRRSHAFALANTSVARSLFNAGSCWSNWRRS